MRKWWDENKFEIKLYVCLGIFFPAIIGGAFYLKNKYLKVPHKEVRITNSFMKTTKCKPKSKVTVHQIPGQKGSVWYRVSGCGKKILYKCTNVCEQASPVLNQGDVWP